MREVFVGDTLSYAVTLKNTSKTSIWFVGRLKDTVELELCRAQKRRNSSRWVISSERNSYITEIGPNKSVDISGVLKILYPDVNQLKIRFSNIFKEIPISEQYRKEELGQLWLGSMEIKKELSINDKLSHVPQYKHRRIASNLQTWRITKQNELFNNIHLIAQGSNKFTAKWLWLTVERTDKNSPERIMCLSELYYLFTNNIGFEHWEKFIAVASSEKEPVNARLLAMDALYLIWKKDYLWCNLHGNNFSSIIDKTAKEKARPVLENLTKDPSEDIATRAKKMLGMKVTKPIGSKNTPQREPW